MGELQEQILIIAQIVTFLLFLSSELLGMSTCKFNGVVEVLINGCGCLNGGILRFEPREEIPLDPIVAVV